MKVFNYSELLIYWMGKEWLNSKMGYAILMSLNSIKSLQHFWKETKLNLKMRGLEKKPWRQKLFPILVFAFRKSERGAMALRARGLKSKKKYYFLSLPQQSDWWIFLISTVAIVVSLIVF